MKQILLIAMISLMIFSCKPDNKSKLEKLKKQQSELADQIKALEKVIAIENGKDSGKIAIVAVNEIKAAEFKHYLEVQGKIDGDQNVAVSPKMLGVITSIDVKEGDVVRTGQVLAHIDDAVLMQSLAALDTSLAFYTNLYYKQKRLWDQKIGSEVQYLSAKNNMESYQNLIKTTKEQLAMAKIVSPIDGTIEDIPIKVGQTVSPGVTTAFRVVNLSKIKVMADIAEAYSAKVKTGNTVQISFPDLDKEITSKVSFASKFINTTNRTFSVEVKLDNTGEEYRANMIAVVKINDYSADSAIIVPVNVIQKMNGANYVYIAVQGKTNSYSAKKVEVKLGQTYNGFTEILGGLKEGDKLITVGYQNLEDGQLLKF